MQEIHRVLKPGGFAILQVPFFNPVPDITFEDNTIIDRREREKIFGQDDHVRKYGRDYPSRIRKAGLIPKEDHFVNELDDDIRKRFGLVRGEVVYVGSKG
jgi:hypothetical protein